MAKKKTPGKTEGTSSEKITFEQALEKLETIVGDMESGNMGLEEMVARFEEGQALLKFCNGKLNEVERKIEMLVKKDGKLETVPFEDEDSNAETRDGGENEANESEGELF
ncbi:MAG: exodeoxyribonuclease VII small subunit [Kiritimatiellia bacterium]